MDSTELLDRLNALLPSQFAEALFRLKVPVHYLQQGAQTVVAIEVIRYLTQTGRLGDLERQLSGATGPATSAATATPGPAPAARSKRHVILFLAANPHASEPRKLAEQCAEIERELKLAGHRDDFRFESRWAVSIDDLIRHLNELDPTVLHFSGNGDSTALLFQGEHGQPQPVSARALTMMIAAAGNSVRVAVLNACFSAVQAEALRAKVDCVVGMDGAIGDDAARAFAVRFYGALASRRSVGNAVAQAVAALAAKNMPDEVMPRCLTRDGIDADRMLLDPS